MCAEALRVRGSSCSSLSRKAADFMSRYATLGRLSAVCHLPSCACEVGLSDSACRLTKRQGGHYWFSTATYTYRLGMMTCINGLVLEPCPRRHGPRGAVCMFQRIHFQPIHMAPFHIGISRSLTVQRGNETNGIVIPLLMTYDQRDTFLRIWSGLRKGICTC